MTKAILSLDYDDCSAILFRVIPEEDTDLDRDRMSEAKKIFLDYLDEIESTHDEVEVYVGSSRQDILLDNYFTHKHKNGSCFRNLEKLCGERGWTLRKLLMADVQNNLPAGSAWENENLQCTSYENLKREIVKAQVEDVKKNHPHEKVDFYFFDDDTNYEYMPAIKNHFAPNLPQHINRLFLVRYDSAEMMFKGKPAIRSVEEITQPKIRTTTLEKPMKIEGMKTMTLQFGLFTDAREYMKNKSKLAKFSSGQTSLLTQNTKKRQHQDDTLMSPKVKKMKIG